MTRTDWTAPRRGSLALAATLLLLAHVACGEITSAGAPCQPGDDSCGPGQVCGDDNECVADPDPDGAAGTAADAAPVDAAVCTPVRALAPIVTTVMLLLDQSASMNEPLGFGPQRRWDALRTTLVDPVTGLLLRLDGKVVFGAALYSTTLEACPAVQVVPPASTAPVAIATLLGGEPLDDTPTGEAVTAVTGPFAATPGPRLLVLATDGDPDTCEDPDNQNAIAQQRSEAAVQAAFAAGIPSAIISIDQLVSLTHLQHLANAGQGQPLEDGTAVFHVAADAAQLTAAFDAVLDDVLCRFQLDVDEVEPTAVLLDGEPLTRGTDWDLAGASTVVLRGEACQAYNAGDAAAVTAELPCP